MFDNFALDAGERCLSAAAAGAILLAAMAAFAVEFVVTAKSVGIFK